MGSREKQPMRRGALGKGIHSLLGNLGAEPEAELGNDASDTQKMQSGIQMVSINQLKPNPKQPRRYFKAEALTELTNSIIQDGIISPIVVTQSPDHPQEYIVIAGERRMRAAKQAGLETVPVILKEFVAGDLLRLALIENIQRQDLNVIEEAEAYRALIEEHGLTQEDCARRVGKDRSTVTNLLRTLHLPNEIQIDIIENRLTLGHGRALLSLEDKKIMLRARDLVCKKGLNVRQTEALCKNFKKNGTIQPQKPSNKSDADLDYLADNLRSLLRTKVKFNGSPSRGKIEICYFSAADLERIVTLMGRGGIQSS